MKARGIVAYGIAGALALAAAGNLFMGIGYSATPSLSTQTAPYSAQATKVMHPIMQPDRATRLQWIAAHERAERTPLDLSHKQSKRSYSILSHLPYTPVERDQGSCGNCWAWAGTGCMEIAHDVQDGVFDRLSVQYINSCESSVIGKDCCDGGWLEDVAQYYTVQGRALPWTNTNAQWQDGDASCDTACASIGLTPAYGVPSIVQQTIPTTINNDPQAIANIKNVLDSNTAIWFAFFMPAGTDWDAFRSFWNTQGESALWDFTSHAGHAWDAGGGGHAVLCVGYDDSNADPAQHYWVMVNSWGTTAGRPNGIFHVKMSMDYDMVDADDDYMLYWENLAMTYGPEPPLPLWDQPPGVNTNAYANQKFPDYPDYNIYMADDFRNTVPWVIGGIFVPGNLWNGGTTLMNAVSLNWKIYADGSGKPDGDPADGGNPPVWSLSLAPGAAQVTLINGVGGMPSNVLLNPTTPISLNPGTYWLVFYPEMGFETDGQYGRHVSDTTNVGVGQVINPGGGFGFPAVWTSIQTTYLVTEHDVAFRLIGSNIPPTPTPTPIPPTPTPTPIPQAEIVLNGTSFGVGSPFTATFKLNQSIERPFTAYAVVFMPGGSMLDAITLGPSVKPVASNMPGLAAPFSYPLISLNIPPGAPTGQYEVVAAFFDPSRPITGRADAFLDVSAKFTIH